MGSEPRSDAFDGPLGRRYDAYIKRPRWARPIGRLLWGGDARQMYELMRAIGEAPAGSTILDAPCGGGLAFRELRPDQDVRYVAIDLSSGMLERARREADQRGLRRVELVQGDLQRLPFEDELADLTLSMNSLHCVPNPAGAIRELVRCTRRGAPFIGSMLVLGAGRRQDRALRHAERTGAAGPGGTTEDLRRWLTDAGLEDVRVDSSGAIAVFESRRPA
jgi:ubiquinone/menaquinone biosynthesis C-methylase UbiE